jgi:hypothetical protein
MSKGLGKGRDRERCRVWVGTWMRRREIECRGFYMLVEVLGQLAVLGEGEDLDRRY